MNNTLIPRKFYIETYGCQMNQADSDALVHKLQTHNFLKTSDPNDADFLILNTCAVRQHAEDKVYSRIGVFNKKYKGSKKIIVLGCLAQAEKKELNKKHPAVDFVIGTYHLSDIVNILQKEQTIATSFNQYHFLESVPEERFFFKAKIDISHGCNNFCSYCIVPYVRGREISRSSKTILENIQRLVQAGVIEIMLLGQNVNSYGQDTKDISFPELLYKISTIDGLKRIRFLTSHPKDFSDELIDVIFSSDKISKYIHLPLQSGSDTVLEKMGRNYTFEHYKSIVDKIRKKNPNTALTTDIMVGFHGEGEKEYQETLDAVKTIRFDDIYMFKYSKRKMTKAFSLEETISEEEKSLRLQNLINIQREISLEKKQKLIGKTVEVLVEEPSKLNPNHMKARTDTNFVVIIPSKNKKIGHFYNITLSSIKGQTLIGKEES